MTLSRRHRQNAASIVKRDLASEIELEHQALKHTRRDLIVDLNTFLRHEGPAAVGMVSVSSLQPQYLDSEALSEMDINTVVALLRASSTSEFSTRLRLLTSEDKDFIQAYPHCLVSQLRICQKVTRLHDDTRKYMCGIECVHCKRFRRFHQSEDDLDLGIDPLKHNTATDIASFRDHLHSCNAAPKDLRRYLSWLDKNTHCSSGKVAKLVSKRLQLRSKRGNVLLSKAIRRVAIEKQKKSRSVLEESLDWDSSA